MKVTDLNCGEHDDTGACTACNEDYYLDSTEGKCLAYTVTNCAEYHPTLDQCKSCKIDIAYSYLNENGKCIRGPIDNCLIY